MTLTATERQVVDAVPKGSSSGGRWVDGAADTFAVDDPSTGEALAEVASAGPAEALAALDAAVAAQAAWAATAPRERAEVLRRAWELMTARADDLALVMTLEMGKPLAESRAEVAYAAEFFRWFSEEACRIEGSYAMAPNGQGRVLVMRQPVGPCLLITPWNFPLAMGTRKMGPAVAAGCTMLVKPARQTPAVDADPGRAPGRGRPARRRAVGAAHQRLRRPGHPAAWPTPGCASCRSPAPPRWAGRCCARPPTRCCARRWSWAATRPSSCSTTPTSTPPWRGRWWPRCATSARPAPPPTASSCRTAVAGPVRPGPWPAAWGR